MYAPIVLFTYNRFSHLDQTVKALQSNYLAEESNLIVFSDAPKSELDVDKVQRVRDLLIGLKGFKDVNIILRDNNFGLSKSIISGVTDVLSSYGKAIILEDDLVTSPYFLKYMNTALHLYEDEREVISIHGYNYPIKQSHRLPNTFFLKGADCWGWATWNRGWNLFEKDGEKLYNKINDDSLLTYDFNFYNTYPYLDMLRDQINGKNDSWAIRWYASAFLRNKYTLYPGRTLINNIGLDGSGTHFTHKAYKAYKFILPTLDNVSFNISKEKIVENTDIKKMISYYLRSKDFYNKQGFLEKLYNRITYKTNLAI